MRNGLLYLCFCPSLPKELEIIFIFPIIKDSGAKLNPNSGYIVKIGLGCVIKVLYILYHTVLY